MAIELDTPIETPAIPAESFDELFITRLVIEFPSLPTPENGYAGHALMELAPYNRAKEILGPDETRITRSSGQLLRCVGENPTGKVAAAFNAIVDAALEWKEWVESQEIA